MEKNKNVQYPLNSINVEARRRKKNCKMQYTMTFLFSLLMDMPFQLNNTWANHRK